MQSIVLRDTHVNNTRYESQLLCFLLKVAMLYACLFSISVNCFAGNLVIESWRTDDAEFWNNKILPEFHRSYPDIRVVFKPTISTEYDNTIKNKLKKNIAGDLITCRPFDASLELFSAGYLEELSTNVNLNNFRKIAKAAWSTDDGAAIFCVPLAVVSNGLFFNQKIFKDLNIEIPENESELFEALDKIKSAGYIPIAFGTKDKWETTQVLMAAVGPNRWKGEQGRQRILTGQLKFTDNEFLSTWQSMSALSAYFPPEYESLSYEQARTMFVEEQAAIFPSGSWDISFLENLSTNKFGVFKYPVLNHGDDCYITNHLDSGIGINSASENKKDAVIFLNWIASQEFANVFANTLNGFYPLSSFPLNLKSDMASEMYRWRKSCKSTLRINSQLLNRGPESLETLLWDVNTELLNQKINPQEASFFIQKSLDAWFYSMLEQSAP